MQSFLHERCKANMCEDCIDLAEEYQELHEIRRREIIRVDEENERIKAEFAQLKRKAEMWEQMARAGLPDIIEAWVAREITRIIKHNFHKGESDAQNKEDLQVC